MALVLATATVYTQSAQAFHIVGGQDNGVNSGGSGSGQNSQGQNDNSQANTAGSGSTGDVLRVKPVEGWK